MATWLIKLSIHAHSGEIVYLKIRGYDPRDLLSGQYLTYEVDYEIEPLCEQEGPKKLCLEKHSRLEHHIGVPGDICPTYIVGKCRGGRFLAGIERFYIPEAYSKYLVTVPPNSEIEVALTAGVGQVKEVYIDSLSLETFISMQREKNQSD